ncbi:hypothetical protein BDW75DRAFT_222531 [Aspergillus navahoensis]
MRTHDDFMRDTDTTVEPLQNNLAEEENTRRKKTRTVHPSTQICRDWMIVSGNVHYARDKASFVPSSYTPISTTLKSNIFSPHDEMIVAGIGDVHLTVPRGINNPSTHTLVLENVLHIPEALCNGFNPLLIGSSMSCHAEYWEGCDRWGNELWFGTRFCGVGRLVIVPVDGRTESDLIEGREYTLSLYVSPEEKRVIMEQAQQVRAQGQTNGQAFGMGEGMQM